MKRRDRQFPNCADRPSTRAGRSATTAARGFHSFTPLAAPFHFKAPDTTVYSVGTLAFPVRDGQNRHRGCQYRQRGRGFCAGFPDTGTEVANTAANVANIVADIANIGNEVAISVRIFPISAPVFQIPLPILATLAPSAARARPIFPPRAQHLILTNPTI